MAKSIIISVGGSPKPLLYTLNEAKPDYIIFLVSLASSPLVHREILPNLNFQPKDTRKIVTRNEEDLLITYRIIIKEVEQCLKDFNLSYSDLKADYTGGTKSMTAALVLALADKGVSFTYVGAISKNHRNKNGLGSVINGGEKILLEENPWDEFAVEKRKQIALYFNSCRYISAMELAREVGEKVSRGKHFFRSIADIIEGYNYWDNFFYKEALQYLNKGAKNLEAYVDGGGGHEKVENLLLKTREGIVRLKRMKNEIAYYRRGEALPEEVLAKNEGVFTVSIVEDIIGNAIRRARIEGKLDDGVIRLYSALEKMVKIRLLLFYNINNSAVPKGRLPPALADEFIIKYTREGEDFLRLPLFPSTKLLYELGDREFAGKLLENKNQLLKILDARNSSFLAHGFKTIKRGLFEEVLSLTLSMLNIKEENLYKFPILIL